MNLAHLLLRRATLSPTSPALCLGGTVVADYARFARHAFSISGSLRSRLKLAHGTRVALLMANCTAYLEVLYGAWAAGCVVVPINAKLHASEVAHILADSAAAILIADEDLAQPLQAHLGSLTALQHVVLNGSAEHAALLRGDPATPVAVDPTETAWLFYTSGTTGRPKGVMQSHRSLLTMTLTYFADVDTATAQDAIIYAAPMSHGAGMYNFANVVAGARHVVPESGGFDADEMFMLAAKWGHVTSFAAPTMIRRLVDHAERTGASSEGFKTLIYGGGPMYVADIQRALRAMGPRFVQIYGQGECPMTITSLSRHDIADDSDPHWLSRLASVGVSQSSVRVRVVDEQGHDAPAGTPGEIVVAGDVVMSGYWNNPDATRDTLRDGWLRTGDVGVLDANGYLTLKDRSKDVIISGGSNIYPREVEEVLLQHPAVSEVAVIGRPDAEWGEEVIAVVVRREGTSIETAELDTHCLAHIARFKRPKAYVFVEGLPKNNYGKVLKRELRDLINPPEETLCPPTGLPAHT
ncbi:AMP-binding protein [Hydrogenophaga sp.]|uniref:AMP-binding protein n=1 Tax=Hydrogenophaga sp. TaxID=1904254 RepID=UPI002719004A|nr:AMP-binding protein [Hydrogenophaga sp.]MDO9435834.1 AMP-binding protein [Hydrogenophaga sp.]